MPFEIVRNDIVNMRVDAIVNTASPLPVIGSGTDTRIHRAAGPQLLAARQRIGEIPRGYAAITPAYQLNARFVIHTVGPVWQDGTRGEAQTLRSCYECCLNLALEHHCDSIAFPLIATGNYGFPKDLALRIAVAAFSEFLLEHEMQIYLVVFNREAFRLSEKLFSGVSSFIDEHYVTAWEKAAAEDTCLREARYSMPYASSCDAAAPEDLDSFLQQKDAGFVETLLELIQARGLKNAAVYKRANMSKQHFSKLICNPQIIPTKPTAIALALALELDLDQTQDLIGRAGYTLTNSSVFDLIIRYFIQHRQYNIIEINVTLYEFDQILLGS